VYLCHVLHSDKDGESYPSLRVISAETGLHIDTVKDGRQSLRNKGLLSTISQRDNKGRFKVPVEKYSTDFSRGGKTSQRENPAPDGGQNTATVKPRQEVDPIYHDGQKPPVCCSEVDPKEGGGNEANETNDAAGERDAVSSPTPGNVGLGKSWAALSQKKKWEALEVKDFLSCEFEDGSADVLDAVGVLDILAECSEAEGFGDWRPALRDVAKLFLSRSWKGESKTIARLRYRLEAEPHDGKTLREQLENILRGRKRTARAEEEVRVFAEGEIDADDIPASKKFSLVLEDDEPKPKKATFRCVHCQAEIKFTERGQLTLEKVLAEERNAPCPKCKERTLFSQETLISSKDNLAAVTPA